MVKKKMSIKRKAARAYLIKAGREARRKKAKARAIKTVRKLTKRSLKGAYKTMTKVPKLKGRFKSKGFDRMAKAMGYKIKRRKK